MLPSGILCWTFFIEESMWFRTIWRAIISAFNLQECHSKMTCPSVNYVRPCIVANRMCLMSDSTFYLGSELDRAVNRLDFFRLY